MLKEKILPIIFLLVWSQNYAQTENRSAGWFTSINSIRLKNKWGAQVDWALRTTDEWKHLQVFILRTGLTYSFNSKVTALVGFNYNSARATVSNVSGYIGEFQVWQQLFLRHRPGPLFTTHRILVEERFIPTAVLDNGEVQVTKREFAMRARYLLRNQLPFKRQKQFSKGVYAITQQEILLNIGDNDAVNNRIFDQFRWFTGLGYRISPKMDVETGYFYRRLATKSALSYKDHVLLLNCFLRL